MDDKACGRCKYWFVGAAPKSIRPDTLGQCRWEPPTLLEKGSFFPTTTAADWCSQYSAADPKTG